MDVLVSHTPTLLFLLGLLFFSGFFSGTETALFSLSREQLRDLQRQRNPVARAIVRLARDPRNLLVTVLFGNMIVNVLFFCMSAVLAGELAPGWRQAAAGLAALAAVLICGEILPKAVGVAYPLAFARVTAVPMTLWHYAITPFRVVLGYLARQLEPRGQSAQERYVTPDELKMLVEISRQGGALESDEQEMIEDIVELAEIRVREIMAPRVDLVLCRVGAPVEEVRRLGRDHTFSLIPVYEDSADNLLGVVSVRDLFLGQDGSDGLRPHLRPIRYVPETKRADDLLRMMLEDELDMVVAVDEYGGTAGIVTLEDLLEAVIGDIDDEFEQPADPEVAPLGDGRYRLSGKLSVREWRELFAGSVPGQSELPATDTIGGFVVYLLGHMPHVGDTVRYRNLRFTVEKIHGRRIESILVGLDESPTTEQAA